MVFRPCHRNISKSWENVPQTYEHAVGNHVFLSTNDTKSPQPIENLREYTLKIRKCNRYSCFFAHDLQNKSQQFGNIIKCIPKLRKCYRQPCFFTREQRENVATYRKPRRVYPKLTNVQSIVIFLALELEKLIINCGKQTHSYTNAVNSYVFPPASDEKSSRPKYSDILVTLQIKPPTDFFALEA